MGKKIIINKFRWIVYALFIGLIVGVSISGFCGKIERWIAIDSAVVSLFAVTITIIETKINRCEDTLKRQEDNERRLLNFCVETLEKVENDVPTLIEEIIDCIEKYKATNELERMLSSKLLKNAVFKDELYDYYAQISCFDKLA